MRITIVADYRSPIAREWIEVASSTLNDVTVISSRPFRDAATNSIVTVPLGPEALLESVAARRTQSPTEHIRPASAGYSSPLKSKLQSIARAAAPLELVFHQSTLRRAIAQTNPDVVHAPRIPFEAMATTASWDGPVVASIWGNDLTLHGPRNVAYRKATRRTLRRVSALHTDCHRDQRLAAQWGFDPERPTLVVPGSGGVRSCKFRPGTSTLRASLGIPEDAPVVLNARGIRGYTRVPEFLEAVSILLGARSDLHVLITGMTGHAEIGQTVEAMRGSERVHLLPQLSHEDMPDLHRSADVALSLTTHDGTPNTLLETMAVGTFPIVSPIESVLEWIEPGVNGFTTSPTDPMAIADAVLKALDSPKLRTDAARHNAHLIATRADVSVCAEKIEQFYRAASSSPWGR